MNEIADILIIAILGILAISVVAALARRFNLAGPLILVVVGAGVSLLPFVQVPPIDPNIILVGVLPPLLYSAAVSLPAIEFRRDFPSISGLSVLLVFISAIVLGLFFHAVIPGLNLFLAIALGAILSPTDAVATTIVKRIGISPRVTTLLDGESLLNDATSLVILRTMTAAAIAGSVEPGQLIGSFLWGVLVALVVGIVVGYANLRLRAWLGSSGAASTAVGFVVPFVAYIPTEHLDGSGLVAAVVAGIVTGQGSARWFTPEQRMSDTLNWRTIELVLEGGVFLIMGLELKDIVRSNMDDHGGLWHGAWLALVALAIVLGVRAVYVSGLVWIQSRRARDQARRRLQAISGRLDDIAAHTATGAPPGGAPGEPPAGRHRRHGRHLRGVSDAHRRQRRVETMRARLARAFADLDYYQASPLGWRHGTVIVWAGMRGVVTLAAAQTLPADSPGRPLLIFVAFLVALISLLVQGTTLPWVVRALGLAGSGEDEASGEEQARLDDELRAAAASALSRGHLSRRDGSPFDPDLVKRVGTRMTEPPRDDETSYRDGMELRLALIEAMRAKLNELSEGGAFSTAALRHSLAELDANQISLELRLDDGS